MTKDTYTKLSKFDKPLMTAYRSSYARISPRDLRELLEIYYGPSWESQVDKSVFSCGTCKLKQLKKIGAEYFKFENEIS